MWNLFKNTKHERKDTKTVKTTKQRHLHRPDVFIVNLEQISHIALVFQMLNLD